MSVIQACSLSILQATVMIRIYYLLISVQCGLRIAVSEAVDPDLPVNARSTEQSSKLLSVFRFDNYTFCSLDSGYIDSLK